MTTSTKLVLPLSLCFAALAGCMGKAGIDVEQRQEAVHTVCPGPVTVDGIDVSHWQGSINWSSVAADGVVFAFIRVSDGDPDNGGTADSQFQANWAAARQVGILRGPYQFFRPSDDPVLQADWLINAIGGAMTPGDLPPVIDVEATDGRTPAQIVAAIQAWINRIETVLGVTPIIYTGPYFWQDSVGSSAFASYPLWGAHYTTGCPLIPDPWSNWTFWQYTSSGSVSGISGNVDMNHFNGTLGALQAMTYGDPVCGDGFCTGDEDHASCPEDCPICENVPPLGRIVDETDLCFQEFGSPEYWRYVEAGWGNTLMWTHTVETADRMDNHGVWSLTFDEAGRYRVEAYTDAAYADSQLARYQVRHEGTVDAVVVDQTAVDGWNLVGDFQFAAGGDQWVRLEDFTGEPNATDTQIVFDAIQVTRLDPPVYPDGGVGPGPDAGDATGLDGGVGPDADTDPDPRSTGGCSCDATGGGPAGAGLPAVFSLMLLGLLLVRRRGRGCRLPRA